MTPRCGRRLVIGVGNPDNGDDAAGRLLARRLRDRTRCAGDDAPVVRECSGEATALMEAWAGFDDVVVVDACRGAGAPGSVHRLEAGQVDRLASLQPHRHRSTHDFGVGMAVALARALSAAPSQLVIYAIEGRVFDAGAAVSAEVDRAVNEMLALLVHPEASSR